MAYVNLGPIRHGYKPRKGLEGPFTYANGRVLYYDPKEGEYWDPKTDFYVLAEEMELLHQQLVDMLRGPANIAS